MDSMDQLQERGKFLKKQHVTITTASDLEYLRAIKKILVEEYSEPSPEMIRFFASQVYSGIQTQQVLDQFAPIVKAAFMQFVNDRLLDRLQPAMTVPEHEVPKEIGTADNGAVRHPHHDMIITKEEFEGFFVVNVI